ncbi:MAG: capsule biosynthesis protein CapA [Rhodobacteraceae bacterium]|nr:capsule biosynthesis protein CapA [Paracoccaceae bacterium]
MSSGGTAAGPRRFLMLQGPHGPFFGQLADMLRAAGAAVWRVGFNAGDEAMWGRRAGYIAFREAPEAWPAFLGDLIAGLGITDIVLYGDTRPVHAAAVARARQDGLVVHVFEEGYLRPWWVTYERGGANGNSRLMDMPIEAMRAALARSAAEAVAAPARWGDMRQHVLWGARYHFHVALRNRGYPGFRPHRDLTVAQEFRLYLRRLLLLPLHALERQAATLRVRLGRFPYHLVLMQLEHDASFRAHSTFASQTEFVTLCLEAFAHGAPGHHHLVFKTHPLEDGRADAVRVIRRTARALGIADRVHVLRGGKLAALLAQARSAVTVNSTAAQQALWRGLPVRAFGRAVYARPGLVSDQPLHAFFAAPDRPDMRAYRDFRAYLLETSQVPGGFYSAAGRRRLLRQAADLLLAPEDPYDALSLGRATPRQQLALVR